MRPFRLSCLLIFTFAAPALSQDHRIPPVPDLRELIQTPQSEFAEIVRRYEADRGSLHRTYTVLISPDRTRRMLRFHRTWLKAIEGINSTTLSEPAKDDRRKLIETIQNDLKQLEELHQRNVSILPLLPFAQTIAELEDDRRLMRPADAMKVAGKVDNIRHQIAEVRGRLSKNPLPVKSTLLAAAEMIVHLRNVFRHWYSYYNGYDPVFTWWLTEPYKDADTALGEYLILLRDTLAPAAQESKDIKSQASLASFPTDDPEPLPNLISMLREPVSELRPVILRYVQDRAIALGRRSQMPGAPPPPRSIDRLRELVTYHKQWHESLNRIEFDLLSLDGQIDYYLLRNHLAREIARWERQIKTQETAASLISFEKPILDFVAANNGKHSAEEINKSLHHIRQLLNKTYHDLKTAPLDFDTAAEAARRLPLLKASLAEWHDRLSKDGSGENVQLVRENYRALQNQLDTLSTYLREQGAPRKDVSGIEGRPIGRDALVSELRHEFIPYTPEELIAIAEKEYHWSLDEMKKASRELGFGDDWKKALEKVKTSYVEPGKQPPLIRQLADEAVQFLHSHRLVTIPPLCQETWRSEMMPPQRQLFSPFFTGGEVISIAYPTNTMSHSAKLQSLRGNNIHFSRATVHHELIPGHHLQGFMASRHKNYRGIFSTPFWTEGNALYWEFLLYQMGFPQTPEDRIGFLTWRMHRSARVIFSIQYHLGKLTPQQCIDYLVTAVGFERDNATAEVRRSFSGGYGPLYQLSYLVGGLQFWELRQEMLRDMKMNECEFHDALLREGRIPVALLRAKLRGDKLTKDADLTWRFYPKLASPTRFVEGPR